MRTQGFLPRIYHHKLFLRGSVVPALGMKTKMVPVLEGPLTLTEETVTAPGGSFLRIHKVQPK